MKKLLEQDTPIFYQKFELQAHFSKNNKRTNAEQLEAEELQEANFPSLNYLPKRKPMNRLIKFELKHNLFDLNELKIVFGNLFGGSKFLTIFNKEVILFDNFEKVKNNNHKINPNKTAVS